MTKLERLIDEARELPASDRLRLIEEVERSAEDKSEKRPAMLGSLVALAGTAESDFDDVSTDKYRHVLPT